MRLFLAISFLLALSLNTKANTFQFNEPKFESEFTQSEDISSTLNIMLNGSLDMRLGQNDSELDESNKQMTAAIIAIASIVVGSFTLLPLLFPTHRFILGTGSKSVVIWAVYCFTLSGLGWLNLIDAVFLLIDDSKSKYVNSEKIILWLGAY
jgi:hypothetical protein